MQSFPIPENEVERLNFLHESDILNTPPEQVFDDFTQLASHICEAPVSFISLIDTDQLWFKSMFGMELEPTPREIAFCSHTILEDRLFLIEDASTDERFAENPVVVGDPNIRFYAGMPLIASGGYALGSLCVIDFAPRSLSSGQQEMLQILRRRVVKQFELKHHISALSRACSVCIESIA